MLNICAVEQTMLWDWCNRCSSVFFTLYRHSQGERGYGDPCMSCFVRGGVPNKTLLPAWSQNIFPPKESLGGIRYWSRPSSCSVTNVSLWQEDQTTDILLIVRLKLLVADLTKRPSTAGWNHTAACNTTAVADLFPHQTPNYVQSDVICPSQRIISSGKK